MSDLLIYCIVLQKTVIFLLHNLLKGTFSIAERHKLVVVFLNGFNVTKYPDPHLLHYVATGWTVINYMSCYLSTAGLHLSIKCNFDKPCARDIGPISLEGTT